MVARAVEADVDRRSPRGVLPPISVYRLCGAHYVRDGHHRVSVARALGATEIDAEVTELRPSSEGWDANGPGPISGA
jgi:ParB-like nuclease domain